ncbi:MAG TPA: hypothetical protein VK139_02250 [Microbacteriaceae bacterium]|nr:hypothetical protein [Microbacteriaceae bacterium]
MNSIRRIVLVSTALAALAAVTVAPPAQASDAGSLQYFVDAPNVQGSYVVGTTETFDSGCSTTWTMGTTDVPCTSNPADIFGGASTTSSTPTTGGSGSNYAAIWPGAPVTLTLTTPATYLGVWWTAGDPFNQLDFYSGSTLVGTFSFQTLVDALQNPTLNGQSGVTYNTSDYYGNPVDGQDVFEPFAYLHVFAAEGSTFDKVVFTELPGTGAFEFDNVTVANGVQTIQNTLVSLAPPPTSTPTPAPAAPALATTGSTALPAVMAGAALIALGVALSRSARRHEPSTRQ